ncbi:MAG: pilus assembly protein PilM [Chitinispirillaceae bacterium]|nr:pilus assembly protein PilM [Chitinispirillaceae bacterium]
MKQTNATISGLDIQNEYLTVAQYNSDEHAVMLVAIQPLTGADGESSPSAVSAEIGALKNKFKFGTAPINYSLPGEFAIIKKMSVESQETDLDGALQWELGQHIIGAVDEYAFDYQQVGTGVDGINEYLMVAYRREQVDSFGTVLKRHKLVAGAVDLDLFALVNVFAANYPEATDRPALLLHAESTRAKLIMTHNENYIDYDSISYEEGTDPHTFAGLLQNTAQRLCSLTMLTGSSAEVPVFAAGALFTDGGYLETLRSATGNVELLHPFRKIGCRVGVDNEQLAAFLPQLSVAVGCALRGGDEL